MISCAISVAESQWSDWLREIGNLKVVRDIELPVSLLAQDADAMRAVENHGLRLVVAHDLLPAETARHLAESSGLDRGDVLTCLEETFEHCHNAGARFVTLEMGLNRVSEASADAELAGHIAFLRQLVPLADELRLTICVQVRTPRPFPGSREWEHAAYVVHEVMHPACRLAVNLVPADLPGDFDISAFVRSCTFHLGVLRFHYAPALGDVLDSVALDAWHEVLQQHGFRGSLVFCPRAAGDTGIGEACARIDRWATRKAEAEAGCA